MADKQIKTHHKVRKLQRSLYQQAKSKPKWKAWSWNRYCAFLNVILKYELGDVFTSNASQMVNSIVNWRTTSESRMRENRTSGLMRGG
jgi:hypothetical protein